MAKKAAKSGKSLKAAKSNHKKTISRATEPKTVIKLPSVWQLTKTAASRIWQQRRLLGGISLVYGFLNLILVQGLASSSDISSLKSNIQNGFSGHLSSLGSGLDSFVQLVGTSGNGSSDTAGAYQLFLAIITSLAVIFALRQIFTGHKIRVRETYYRGMYPLIPFILVVLVLGIDLLPVTVGAYLYSAVTVNAIAIHFLEKLIFIFIFILLASWTFYMLTSTIFALYIVSLPDMTPLRALRSARQLVSKRRLSVFLRLIWLPIALLIVAGVIMLPIIIWLTFLSQWIFFILTMFILVAVHTYFYTLYRELLDD
jgi:hypothetical protein